MMKHKCEIALLFTVSLTGFVYPKSNYLEDVKFQIIDETTGKPLINQELNVCKFVNFKLQPGPESPYLDKSAEWFITSVTTDEQGIFILDLSSIKEKHIVIEPGEQYGIVRFSRTSDLEGTESFDHIKVTQFQTGLINRIYDLRRGRVKIITYSGKVTEEPYSNIIITVRKQTYEICSEAKNIMLKFQKALKNNQWDIALALCSEKVKSKASDYDSPEAFLRNVVPVKEITSLLQFQTSGGTYNRQNEQIAYRCFLRIPTEGSIEAVDWVWTICKDGKGWLIDFNSMSLDKWIENETFRLTNEATEFRKRSDQLNKGIEIKLTALNEEFIIGQPMLFCVEMHNISESPIGCVLTSSIMVNDPMLIKDPDGNIIPYIDTSYQTGLQDKKIRPGEKIILADNYDVTTQYRITRPGQYTFQFNGFKHYRINPSNIVEVDVKPGELSPADSILEKLLNVLPKDWDFTKKLVLRRNKSEKISNKRIYIHLQGQSGEKGTDTGIGVLILVCPSEKEDIVEPEEFAGRRWGKCKWGDVYVISFDADVLWANYKEQIIKALEIK